MPIEKVLKDKEDEADALFFLVATEEQKARYAAGYLPKRERDDAARDAVFAPLRDAPLYEKFTNESIEHTAGCPWRLYDGCDDPLVIEERDSLIGWLVEETHELTAEQFATFNRIKQAMDSAQPIGGHAGLEVAVIARAHVGDCSKCSRRVRTVGILVTVTTRTGNVYKREFAAKEAREDEGQGADRAAEGLRPRGERAAHGAAALAVRGLDRGGRHARRVHERCGPEGAAPRLQGWRRVHPRRRADPLRPAARVGGLT